LKLHSDRYSSLQLGGRFFIIVIPFFVIRSFRLFRIIRSSLGRYFTFRAFSSERLCL